MFIFLFAAISIGTGQLFRHLADGLSGKQYQLGY